MKRKNLAKTKLRKNRGFARRLIGRKKKQNRMIFHICPFWFGDFFVCADVLAREILGSAGSADESTMAWSPLSFPLGIGGSRATAGDGVDTRGQAEVEKVSG